MSSPIVVISLENVSVEYQVPIDPVNSIKEYFIKNIRKRIKYKSFLALDEINLTVRQGEVCAVIGRNGAGKSTLMKVISRVLVPQKGRVCVRGNVYPLLQLGAGFHPELTGKENIYLNGSLLGHRIKDVKNKYQKIIEFAEIDEFIDAPVRTYSTGMRARLGFAIATAWIPDILILDEVLSVSDYQFHQKCVERIESFRKGGATVLIVSHTIETLHKMCNKAVWLEHGKIRAIGPADEVLETYQKVGIN